ncbi:MAG TPA: hypothetical protein VMB50_08290 [Myxococcales bacterium]|nr:hypothetical protein [Myxococcales bacterium]
MLLKVAAIWGASLAATGPVRALRVDLRAAGASCRADDILASLRLHLPGLTIAEGVGREDGEATLALRSGARWRLRIRVAGEPALERDLPAPGPSCLSFAERVALVASRYLEDLHASGVAAPLEPLPPPPPPPRWHLDLSAGATAELGLVGVAPAGALDLGVHRGPWQVELSGAWFGGSTVAVVGAENTPASLNLGEQLLALAGGWRWSTRVGALRLEGVVGGELFEASTTGGLLFHRSSDTAVAPFVGARVAYDFWLWRGLFVGPRLDARVHLGSVTVDVDGVAPVTKVADGSLGISAGYVFL